MLNKELIMQVFENHSMKAKVYGALTNLIPETEYSEMAHEILLLLKPIDNVPPQLQQHDVSGCCSQCGTKAAEICGDCVSSIYQAGCDAGYNGR
jgi:hypothetical protein